MFTGVEYEADKLVRTFTAMCPVTTEWFKMRVRQPCNVLINVYFE